MRFEHPEWLWFGFIAATAMVALVYAWYRRRLTALAQLGSSGLLARLTSDDLAGAPGRRLALLVGALALMGFAFAGPQWGAQEVEQQSRALSLVFAIDVSESMWAADVRPNRLERARLEARRLVNELRGHRIGLVAFAGEAYRMSPLTIDHGAVQLFLDALDPTLAGTPGSSLALAVHESAALLREDASEGGDRAIILISDGESHDDSDRVMEEARAAKDEGIQIYALAVGSERGEPIPRYDRLGAPIGGFKRDADGEVVLSRMTREPLLDVTSLSKGLWTRAEEGGARRISAALAELEFGSGSFTRNVRWTPRFQLFLAVALALVVLDLAFAWRWFR